MGILTIVICSSHTAAEGYPGADKHITWESVCGEESMAEDKLDWDLEDDPDWEGEGWEAEDELDWNLEDDPDWEREVW